MGGTLGTEKSRLKQEELKRMMDQVPPEINLDEEVPFESSWIFSVIGALVAIPVGAKRKSLGPLLFYGTTGGMLDVIVSVQEHERKRYEWLRNYTQNVNKQDEQQHSDEEIQQQEFAFVSEDTDPWTEKQQKHRQKRN